ncbi:hypothetical protein NE237_006436 [Protea cynaroides]|uniref:Subtilisin-like protease fibronectin type-III domain-containing protein n=1 Tax=Protea cynaroides TaxID=273540 RepID=A0A9Q0KMI0_9MAGN|nr:hypothetical protein NE237_006436 [Protea cynaroides]
MSRSGGLPPSAPGAGAVGFGRGYGRGSGKPVGFMQVLRSEDDLRKTEGVRDKGGEDVSVLQDSSMAVGGMQYQNEVTEVEEDGVKGTEVDGVAFGAIAGEVTQGSFFSVDFREVLKDTSIWSCTKSQKHDLGKFISVGVFGEVNGAGGVVRPNVSKMDMQISEEVSGAGWDPRLNLEVVPIAGAPDVSVATGSRPGFVEESREGMIVQGRKKRRWTVKEKGKAPMGQINQEPQPGFVYGNLQAHRGGRSFAEVAAGPRTPDFSALLDPIVEGGGNDVGSHGIVPVMKENPTADFKVNVVSGNKAGSGLGCWANVSDDGDDNLVEEGEFVRPPSVEHEAQTTSMEEVFKTPNVKFGNDGTTSSQSGGGVTEATPVPNLWEKFSVTRTVTNVGKPRSIYKAVVSSPPGINVTVAPKYLVFNSYGQQITFTVNFKVIAPSKEKTNLSVIKDPYEAAKGAHGVCILTEWNEFKSLDCQKIYDAMEKLEFFFDGRNMVNVQAMRKIGFIVYSVGKPLDDWIKDLPAAT